MIYTFTITEERLDSVSGVRQCVSIWQYDGVDRVGVRGYILYLYYDLHFHHYRRAPWLCLWRQTVCLYLVVWWCWQSRGRRLWHYMCVMVSYHYRRAPWLCLWRQTACLYLVVWWCWQSRGTRLWHSTHTHPAIYPHPQLSHGLHSALTAELQQSLTVKNTIVWIKKADQEAITDWLKTH